MPSNSQSPAGAGGDVKDNNKDDIPALDPSLEEGSPAASPTTSNMMMGDLNLLMSATLSSPQSQQPYSALSSPPTSASQQHMLPPLSTPLPEDSELMPYLEEFSPCNADGNCEIQPTLYQYKQKLQQQQQLYYEKQHQQQATQASSLQQHLQSSGYVSPHQPHGGIVDHPRTNQQQQQRSHTYRPIIGPPPTYPLPPIPRSESMHPVMYTGADAYNSRVFSSSNNNNNSNQYRPNHSNPKNNMHIYTGGSGGNATDLQLSSSQSDLLHQHQAYQYHDDNNGNNNMYSPPPPMYSMHHHGHGRNNSISGGTSPALHLPNSPIMKSGSIRNRPINEYDQYHNQQIQHPAMYMNVNINLNHNGSSSVRSRSLEHGGSSSSNDNRLSNLMNNTTSTSGNNNINIGIGRGSGDSVNSSIHSNNDMSYPVRMNRTVTVGSNGSSSYSGNGAGGIAMTPSMSLNSGMNNLSSPTPAMAFAMGLVNANNIRGVGGVMSGMGQQQDPDTMTVGSSRSSNDDQGSGNSGDIGDLNGGGYNGGGGGIGGAKSTLAKLGGNQLAFTDYERPTLFELLKPHVRNMESVNLEFESFQAIAGWMLGSPEACLPHYALWKPAARCFQFAIARMLSVPKIDFRMAPISPRLRRSILLVSSMQYRCHYCAAHAASVGELLKGSWRSHVASKTQTNVIGAGAPPHATHKKPLPTPPTTTTSSKDASTLSDKRAEILKPIVDPLDRRNSPQEADVLRLVTAASRIPSKVSAELKKKVVGGIGEEGLQMVACISAFFGWTNAITDSVGMELNVNEFLFASQQIGPAGWKPSRHAPEG
ncbi:hypothetical protein HDU76_003968, partial [Blyttiomyces sp. JEL0837]